MASGDVAMTFTWLTSVTRTTSLFVLDDYTQQAYASRLSRQLISLPVLSSTRRVFLHPPPVPLQRTQNITGSVFLALRVRRSCAPLQGDPADDAGRSHK